MSLVSNIKQVFWMVVSGDWAMYNNNKTKIQLSLQQKQTTRNKRTALVV